MIKTLLPLSLLLLVACNQTGSGRSKDAVPGTGSSTSVQGATADEQVARSQMGREIGVQTMTYAQEATFANTKFPSGYHETASVELTDNGLGASQVIFAKRPTIKCGETQTSVKDRLSDCATKNSSTSTWIGVKNGNAGEGNWQLVLFSNTQEIWIDLSTSLLWSSKIENTSWCNAAGNLEAAVAPLTVDCNKQADAHNTCMQFDGLVLGNKEASWRLPTRNDFLQADLNGARFVLPSINETYWTATIDGTNRDQAIAIEQRTGFTGTANRLEPHSVRCLGRVL